MEQRGSYPIQSVEYELMGTYGIVHFTITGHSGQFGKRRMFHTFIEIYILVINGHLLMLTRCSVLELYTN